MKKVLSLLVVVFMALCLCGCQDLSKEDLEKIVDSAQTVVDQAKDIINKADETVKEAKEEVGAWAIKEGVIGGKIDDATLAIFNKACEGFAGQGFEPLALMATQVVAGTNYMFLCKGTTVTANPETALKVVTIYADLQGNAQILKVADFNLTDYLFDNSLSIDQLAGGWTVNTGAQGIDAEPLKKATDGLMGVSYKPIAQLGTQVVAGTNYSYLVVKTIVLANPVSTISVINVFENLKGECSILSVCDLDVSEFNK